MRAALALVVFVMVILGSASHQAVAEKSATGPIGAGVVVLPPVGYALAPATECQANELAMALDRVRGLGTRWQWVNPVVRPADVPEFAGLYHYASDKALLSVALPCQYVASVAWHEYAHALQHRAGTSFEHVPAAGSDHPQFELVADCFALTLADRVNVPAYGSYVHGLNECTGPLFDQTTALLASAEKG